MNVLVTGGAGFIGSHSAEALAQLGHTVRVLDNLSAGKRENLCGEIELIVGDIRDVEVVSRAMRGVEAVLHLAGVVGAPQSLAHPLETYEVNTRGAVNVFDAARAAGVRRVVFSSTAAVYGDVPGTKTEASPLRPLVPYAASKLMAEVSAADYARNYDMDIVRLRYFNAFGPRQLADSSYSGVTALFAAALKAGQPCVVFGDGENTRDFVSVRDVAQANARALVAPLTREAADDLDSPRCPVYNIGSGNSASVNDILRALEQVTGKPIARAHKPARDGEIRHSSADVSRAERELEWTPRVTLEQGLRELLASQ